MHLKNKQIAESKARLFEKIEQSGVLSTSTLKALASVDRENYVDEKLVPQAYDDSALPIQAGQTISQVLIVGIMIEALNISWEDKLLEIGTGSGYQTAVLARLNRRVFSIERFLELVHVAEKNLESEPNNNYTIIHADGYEGFTSQSPFDKIIVSAASENIPDKLLQQMKVGGIMVLPLGQEGQTQELLKVIKTEDSYTTHSLGFVKFVPMLKGTV
ncbi:MAG TPA: protein-L-isoaspartate O-methyltransferase [Alphaproteobacteria bacterium]|nr:protein-L-isoaspartate O-methyltransferase [Alphaproteobacteria bacterium]